MNENSALYAIGAGLFDSGKFSGDARPIAECVVVALSQHGYQIVEKSSLKAMQEAVGSRAAMAAVAHMLEGAKPGDVIDNWPPLLSPPTGWRKETWHESGGYIPGTDGEHETLTKAKIIKD